MCLSFVFVNRIGHLRAANGHIYRSNRWNRFQNYGLSQQNNEPRRVYAYFGAWHPKVFDFIPLPPSPFISIADRLPVPGRNYEVICK